MAKRLKSGHVLRIPLMHNFGFAYAKYLNINNIHQNQSYPDLIKVFDYRSPIDEEINFSLLNRYIMQPILLAGRLSIIRENRWQVVGELPITLEDKELPDLRVPEWSINDRMSTPQPPKHGATLYTKNLILRPNYETAISNVEHLEFLSAYPCDMIEASVTMCFMIKEAIVVSKFFDLQNENDRYIYSIYNNRPLANNIPAHLYGKAKQPNEVAYVVI